MVIVNRNIKFIVCPQKPLDLGTWGYLAVLGNHITLKVLSISIYRSMFQ